LPLVFCRFLVNNLEFSKFSNVRQIRSNVGYDEEGRFASRVISNHYSDSGDNKAHGQSDLEASVSLCPCYLLASDVFHALLSSASVCALSLVYLSDLLQLCSYLEIRACFLTRSSVVLEKYRVIHKSLRDFRTRLRNNQDRNGRKEHINR